MKEQTNKKKQPIQHFLCGWLSVGTQNKSFFKYTYHLVDKLHVLTKYTTQKLIQYTFFYSNHEEGDRI
jgi:hypothetical protein